MNAHTPRTPAPSRLTLWLIAALLFCLAFVPRAVGLGRFLTIDESYHWFHRAPSFLAALREGNWAATNLIGHPGVITMWLGSLGLLLQEQLAAWGLLAINDDTTRMLLRLPMGIANSACVVAAWFALRRLIPKPIALLATILWACEPFLIAYSQILHVDALLTSFTTLAILHGMVAFRLGQQSAGRIRFGWLCSSAVFAGLGLLTKSPAVISVPMLGLIALLAVLMRTIGHPQAATPFTRFVHLWFKPLLSWAAIAVAVWVALWPAAWVDPVGSFLSIVHQAESDGGSPHGWGNFFMGQAVDDPGALFYPVALLLRLTPWTLLGLFTFCVLWMLQSLRRISHNILPDDEWLPSIRGPKAQHRTVLLLLLLFAILFVVMVTIPAKKFDRYALPAVPSLCILAAAGWAWLWQLCTIALRNAFAVPSTLRSVDQREFTHTQPSYQVAAKAFGWFVLMSLLTVNLMFYHPYEISYYNPLLGGGAAAAQRIPVGWGEGLDLAGDYILSQPDGREHTIATWYRPALKPYIDNTLVPLGDIFQPNLVGYAVLYLDQVQRMDDYEATQWLQLNLRPVHTISLHGIDYAQIYRVPRLPQHDTPADFGSAIHLRGYDVDTSTLSEGFVRLTVHWLARETPNIDYSLFVHVLDDDGNLIGALDVDPAGNGPSTSQWQAYDYHSAVLQVPIWGQADQFWLSLGLYDPNSGARAELSTNALPDAAPSDGPNAMLLGPLP